ncbi:cell division protein ZapD [Psychromonas sp. MME2]|uniref:cell division protein ZapD n=1 Tax=unclassified Psychromonas TaxID=2614957 RepID=UPI00339C17C9
MIAFEYPLNEKIRSYLRFEFLFLQINETSQFANHSDMTAFFKNLFDLLELIERCDIRHDLIKDLRQLSGQMKEWLSLDQVDHQAVSTMIAEIEELVINLSNMPKQLRYFKTNRFLTSLKQRFSIPSGTCNFDLPQFHFWMNSELSQRQQDAQKWLSHFVNLDKALSLFLKMKRSQGVASDLIAQNGFYQGEVENCSFVIINVAKNQAVYPMISGHKNRYAIRFMNADIENHRAENVSFQQICC